MLTLLPDTPAHVVAYVLDGTATAPDIRNVTREVEAATARGHVHLFGEIAGLGGLTLDAVRESLRESFRVVTRLGQVDRYAVVTDEGWIGTVAKLQAALVPGLDLQVWPRAEREDALAWAAEPLAP